MKKIIDRLKSPVVWLAVVSQIALIVAIFNPEITDTVKYFINYGDSYRLSEIAYITFRYLFLLLLALGAHFLVASIKNKVLKDASSDAKEGKNE